MCMMLFIGSDIPLSVKSFNEDAPGFHTEILNEENRIVIKHFSTKHVLYAGSSEGCGCGFQHALIDKDNTWLPVINENKSDELNNDMTQLHEYVTNLINQGGNVELYACWAGDYEEVPLSQLDVHSEELLSRDFFLKERGFYALN